MTDFDPGLVNTDEARRQRDLIRRRTLGKLGTARRSPIRTRTRDDERATRPLETFRAAPKRT